MKKLVRKLIQLAAARLEITDRRVFVDIPAHAEGDLAKGTGCVVETCKVDGEWCLTLRRSTQWDRADIQAAQLRMRDAVEQALILNEADTKTLMAALQQALTDCNTHPASPALPGK